jgi:hypothetical protein
MSTKGRIGLLALAAVIAVVAFVLARPDEGSEQADDPGAGMAQTGPAQEDRPTATAESAPPPPPTEIVLKGGRVDGGVQKVEAKAGATVRFVVTSDAADDIHLHGYDIEKQVAPGKPARFRLKADLEGVFEIESHVAEDAGRDPLIARLVVEPS